MGVWDSITEVLEAAMPWGEVEAEAPAEETQETQDDAPKSEVEAVKATAEAEEESAAGEQPEQKEAEAEAEEDEEEEEEEDEEEEEEEEEPVCPKETLEEECKNSPACAPAKHHFDECVERVTKATDENGSANEDCVEEFFHLAHCAADCAAPQLWSKLK